MLRQTRVPLTLPKVCEFRTLLPTFCAMYYAVLSTMYTVTLCCILFTAAVLNTLGLYPDPAWLQKCGVVQHACHDWQVLVVSCNLRDKANMAWWAAHRHGDGSERPWLPSALRVSCDSQEWQVGVALIATAHAESKVSFCFSPNSSP